MHRSRVESMPHFGGAPVGSELVTSFQGEGDLSHSVYRPSALNETVGCGMGDLGQDILDLLGQAAGEAGSAAAGSILGEVAKTPEAQAQAKKAGIEAAIDWLLVDNRWVWVLGGTAAAGVGITVLIQMVVRGARKKK